MRSAASTLAGTEFIRDVDGHAGADPEIPRPYWQPCGRDLREIFATETDPIAAAYRRYGYTLREIAAHLGCHYATVSRRLRKAEPSSNVRDRKT